MRHAILLFGLVICAAVAPLAGVHGVEEYPRETVVAGLKDVREAKRLQSIKHAIRNAEADSEMIALLAKTLKDESAAVRRAGAAALESLGTPHPIAANAPTPPTPATQANTTAAPTPPTQLPTPASPPESVIEIKVSESHAREAVPALIEAAADKDVTVRAAIVSALGALGKGEKSVSPILIAALKDESPQMRVTALEALRRFGAAPSELQSELVAAALSEKHPDVINMLASTLAELKPIPAELLPFYINGLKGSNALRNKCVDALYKMGDKAIPAMLPLMKSELVLTRREAAAFIEKFAKNAKEAVPQLTVGLTDTDVYVRRSSIAALSTLGPDAMGALPELIKMLAHTDSLARAAAASAIENLGPAAAKDAVPALSAMLSEKTLASRNAAARALAKMGDSGCTELLAQLKAPRDEIRTAVSIALATCGDSVLPGLADVLKSDSPDGIAAALSSLDRMGGAREPAIARVIPLLRYKMSAVRSQAATVLAKSGSRAVKPLLNALETMTDATPELRAAMTEALGRAGKDAIPPLMEIIKAKQEGPMLYAAIEALGKVGPVASDATPLLMGMLATVPATPATQPAPPPVPLVRTKASAALTQAQIAAAAVPIPATPQTIPNYVKLDVPIIQALGGFGTGAEAALSVLFEMLKDGDFNVRSEAGRAIGRIAKGTERIPPLGETIERCDGGSIANALRPFKDVGMNALIVELDTPNATIRSRVGNVFSNLPQAATYPFLSAALKNDEPRIRSGVAQILADFRRINRKSSGAPSAPVSPTILDPLLAALKEGVKDADPDVRVSCAYAYQKAIDADDGELIERVATGLAKCSPENRTRGMIALDFYNLEKFSRRAAAALPVLVRLNSQDYPNSYASPKSLLHRIGVTKDDVQVLLEVVKEKNYYGRRNALLLIASLGAEAKDAAAPLVEAMADDDKGAKNIEPTIHAIGLEAVPALIEGLKSTNIKVRFGVTQALSTMNLDGEWLGKIAALLSDDRAELRSAALAVLSTSVDRAKYALPHLKDMLVDGDKAATKTRLEFFAVLGAEATPMLLDAMKDPNPIARTRAALALKPRGTLAPPAEALKPLTALLKDDNTDVKAAALQTLSAYVEGAADILPGLVDAMKDESTILRRSALLYIKQHGAEAPAAALEALAIAMKDPTSKIRLSAIDAMTPIGAPAGPMLFEAIGDADHSVRALAAATLEKLGLANDPDKKILIAEMFALDAIEQYAQAQEEHFIKVFDENRVHYYAAVLSDLATLPKSLCAANNVQEAPVPYNGFLFKMLEGQSASAPGGAKKYMVDGKLTQGHALVAFPAEYGKSGRFTFIVGDDSTIYKKDLGAESARICGEMRELNPDDTWIKFKVKPKDETPVRFHPNDPEAGDDMEF